MASLGFFMYSIMSLANSESFTSFPILIPFTYFFSFLIVVDRTSKTMSNNSGKSGQSCLVLILRENTFSYSSFRIMFDAGLSYIAFIILKYFPSMPNF